MVHELLNSGVFVYVYYDDTSVLLMTFTYVTIKQWYVTNIADHQTDMCVARG